MINLVVSKTLSNDLSDLVSNNCPLFRWYVLSLIHNKILYLNNYDIFLLGPLHPSSSLITTGSPTLGRGLPAGQDIFTGSSGVIHDVV